MECRFALQKISLIVERELVSETVEADISTIACFLQTELQRRNTDWASKSSVFVKANTLVFQSKLKSIIYDFKLFQWYLFPAQ